MLPHPPDIGNRQLICNASANQMTGSVMIGTLTFHTLRKINQNTGFFWSILFSRIWTESLILTRENTGQRKSVLLHSVG